MYINYLENKIFQFTTMIMKHLQLVNQIHKQLAQVKNYHSKPYLERQMLEDTLIY